MARPRFLAVIFANPDRNFVFWMHVLLAAIAGTAGGMSTRLGWWSAAIAVAILAVLELALRSRVTAWLALVVGTAFSAATGAVLGAVIAIEISPARIGWWIGGALGALVIGVMTVGAYRKVLASLRR